MKKLKQRWERFKVWRAFCKYGKINQWLIFLGLKRDCWFENFPY